MKSSFCDQWVFDVNMHVRQRLQNGIDGWSSTDDEHLKAKNMPESTDAVACNNFHTYKVRFCEQLRVSKTKLLNILTPEYIRRSDHKS